MRTIFFILILVFSVSCTSVAQEKKQKNPTKEMTKKADKVVKTEAEWQTALSPQEYYVLREKGTDRPGDGGYTKHFEKGTYHCRACDAQLFESGSKFASDCGWPSFDDAIAGTIEFTKDSTLGMVRTEITCTKCDGHIGHIFDDGPKETTGKRYCVNTSSIKFVKTK